MEQKVAESETKIANLEAEVQDLKKSAKHPLQDVPELESMLKDIKTSLVLNGGGISTPFFSRARESYSKYKLKMFFYFSGLYSCEMYKQYGINATGHYYMRPSGRSQDIQYIFCDFEAMDYSTCSDYYKAGYNQSGKYNVYLDGHTVSVDCDLSYGRVLGTLMESAISGKRGITKFSHNKMATQEIENCAEKNCFKLDMKYDQPMEIIDAIKAKSTHCHQKITVRYYSPNRIKNPLTVVQTIFTFQFSCFFSPLSMVGSWIDRFGNAQTYFSGTSGSHICDCASSFVNQCYQLPYLRGHLSTCNCDARDPVLRSDEGIITNKVLNFTEYLNLPPD